MAVAISGAIYKGESSSSSSLSVSVTVPSGSDRLQKVGVSSFDAKPTGVVFNTTETHTEIQTSNSTVSEHATIYHRVAPTETTANVVTSFAGAEEVVVGIINFTGVDQATPLDDSDTAGTSLGSATSTSIVLTSQVDGMAVDVLSNYNETITVGADQTVRWEEDNGAAAQSGYGSTEPGAATVTMSWTISPSGTFAHVAMALKPAAGGPAANPKGPLGMPLHGPFGGPV